MSSSEIDRKIAVIFVADVVGYSKHMEKDENATFKAYGECETILNKLLKKYKGSIFNTAGDSVLAEFPSAVNAVECAVDFQNDLKKRNESEKTEVKLEFRIGINMGDVVMKNGNLLGDGVNIAARLEALAQPNGISISKSVYDLVVPKTKASFNDLGVQKVKQNTFHAYDILLDPSQKRKIKSQSSFSMPMVVGMAAAIVILLGGVFYFNYNTQVTENIYKNEKNIDELPIILVKPLNNLGSTDNPINIAITESIITSLSQYKGINVLSSSTSFYVKENKFDDQKIRTEYNANYIIQGSVQSFGNNRRLTIELNDLSKNSVVWSKKVDFKLDDIFKVQDNIGMQILEELQVKAVVGQQAATWFEEFGFETFEQYTLFLNIRREGRKGTLDGYKNRENLMKALIKSNANQNILDYLDGWFTYFDIFFKKANNIDVKKDIEKLDLISTRLINNLGNNEAYALRAMTEIHIFSKDCKKSIELVEKALDLKPSVDIYTIAGGIYFVCNNFQKTLEYQKKALFLMPNDNGFFVTKQYVATLYMLDKNEEIINIIKSKIDSVKEWRIPAIYAAVEMEKGNKKRAKELYTKALDFGLVKKEVEFWHLGFYNKINPVWEKIEAL
jgi:class 3 adenylate cyclase/TolB-like protein